MEKKEQENYLLGYLLRSRNTWNYSFHRIALAKTVQNNQQYRTWFPFLFMEHRTANKFSIKDFFSKCEQIRSFLQIWSNLLKKSVTLFRMERGLLATFWTFFSAVTSTNVGIIRKIFLIFNFNPFVTLV